MNRANTPRAKKLLVAFAIAACALPAASCGPDFPSAIFVLTTGPGTDYAAFARGRLGIPQQPYRTRHLAIAFDYLTGRPLTATEQQQAVTVNQHFVSSWADDPDNNPDLKRSLLPTGFDRWLAARNAFSAGPNPLPTDHAELYHRSTGNFYDQFLNCLDDAFATASRTLAARIAAHGAADPAVVEWVHGQDMVFANCGTVPAPQIPQPVTSGWLQQDRAYQIAAARFYATQYDLAADSFRAIAADTTSPWSTVSRYLLARALIRKATMSTSEALDDYGNAAHQAKGKRQLMAGLLLAQKELLAMRSEPRMASMSGPIDDLLDFVNLRLQPGAEAAVLADRLHAANPRNFGQSLIDLTYLRTNPTDFDSDTYKPPTPHGSQQDAAGMLDWIDAINSADEASALKHWRATRQPVWLLAAITFAQAADASTPELLAAAQALPISDPAFIAVNYHRLRLMPANPATRAQLLAVLPNVQSTQSPSTVDLYTALAAATAPTLEAWLVAAPRRPAGEEYDGDINDFQSGTDAPAEDICGVKTAPHTGKLFDTDAAYTFNHLLPLRLLAEAAESTTLPANLRYQVAQAAWARAVLLDQAAIARRMSPLLNACRPAWKSVLAAYDTAATPTDRHAAALLALMRFASLEPSVREGEERRNGFATYDEFRQNWWCTTVPGPGSDVDAYPNVSTESHMPPLPPTPPTPPFLSPGDLTEAAAQVAQLETIPNASTYFAQQALAFFKTNPNDPRTPDILGEADRVLRNACRNDAFTDSTKPNPNPSAAASLAHQIFNALHQHYPESPWTKRYKTWE